MKEVGVDMVDDEDCSLDENEQGEEELEIEPAVGKTESERQRVRQPMNVFVGLHVPYR